MGGSGVVRQEVASGSGLCEGWPGIQNKTESPAEPSLSCRESSFASRACKYSAGSQS